MPRGRRRRKTERWIKPYIRPTDLQHSHNKSQKRLTRKFKQHASIFASGVVKKAKTTSAMSRQPSKHPPLGKPWSRREANPSDPGHPYYGVS